MAMRVDHVVFWVEDPLRSIEFYERVVGLASVRVDEFRAGSAPFPSVRISDDTIIDLMGKAAAPLVNALTATDGSAGHPVNHVCLAMTADDVAALRGRLDDAGIAVSGETSHSFGARGFGSAFYFRDPDGNVLEARHY